MAAAARRSRPRLRLTDTTFRDGNQSLLGGRLRAAEIVPLARKLDAVGFAAFEAFGGATFETQLRAGDDPWSYLRDFARATPNTPVQALIRGQNLVGHHNYADDAVELFVKVAARLGVDVFRVFDPLNDLRNMEVAVRAAKRAKRRVQGALCYAVSPTHDLTLWISLSKGLAELDVDELVIKDTSGLLSPQATWELVSSLREASGLPVVVHSHCSSGMAPMAYMAAVEAGAAALDTALSPLAWGASQPATESVVAALAGGDYDTGLDLGRLLEARDDLRVLVERHAADVRPLADRIDADILRYGMPVFMIQDIQRELDQHGAGGRMREALEEVPRVREELGYPPLVAPLRQMIASQAVFNVIGERYATVTQELKDYLQGLYGRPPRPADTQVRRDVLGREEPITIRPADLLGDQVETARLRLRRRHQDAGDEATLTHLLFPGAEMEAAAQRDAAEAEAEAAAETAAAAEAPEPEGPPPSPPAPPAPSQAAEFQVEVEGEVFNVRVTGSGLAVGVGPDAGAVAPAPAAVAGAPPPAPKGSRDGAVLAPMQGLIVKVPVKVGDQVALGDVVAVLEAMKMQNDIVATRPGKVLDVYVREGEVVKPDQALVAVG
ncbi:MAG: pyruvate carboxylase subunit B [Candidatus Dormibacteraeota bacterium]|nr:pyruvate carboxylase subunit B [Candidatus Dormibacteraeota bacterium]